MHFDSIANVPTELITNDRVSRRLFYGIAASIVFHALILSLQLGIPGFDLPGLELPWKSRRAPVAPLQVELANPTTGVPLPPAPAVTTTEMFKLPDPVLPAPKPKPSVESSTPVVKGIVLVPLPLPAVTPPKAKLLPQKVAKSKVPRKVVTAPPPAEPLRVPPPVESPLRIIAQDQVKNDDFVVPLTSPDEAVRKPEDKKENKQKLEAIPADAIIDKDADPVQIEEQKQRELLAKKVQEELQQKKREEERKIAEKKHLEDVKLQEAIAKANEEKLQKKIAENLAESLLKQTENQAAEVKKQQDDALSQQKQVALQRAAQELTKREREQAIEDAIRESKRQELLSQETLKQEELKRQAEQKRVKQLALEEQQKLQAQMQAQLRQKQLEEQAEKQKALDIAERKKAEDIANQKITEQRLLEQKIVEQKQAEQKLAEQKALEQKLQDQKLLDQKVAEQKQAEQRALEQRLAEQKIAEQKLAEQRQAEQRQAEQRALAEAQSRANAERAALAAKAQAGTSNAKVNDPFGTLGSSSNANNGNSAANTNGNGSGANNGSKTNGTQALNTPGTDLATRLREQARSSDLFKSANSPSPTAKMLDDNRARRRSFLGAYDKEVPLRMYVDSIKGKLERNGNLIYERRTLSDVEHSAIVNMVIRSDGSVEDVTIIKSSGNRSLDEQARNLIMVNSPYSVFPPTLAAKYDVIEVQRIWVFGDRLRIIEDLRY